MCIIDHPHGDRITQNLYRVAWWDVAGPDLVNCDVYAVDCGDIVVLIDSGRGGLSYPYLKENLIHWGLWDRLTLCLLTHMHRDHAGGVEQLRAEGIKVWAGEAAAAYQTDSRAIAYFEGNVPHIDRVLADGETFALGNVEFEALATPGHTSTCVTYIAKIDGLRCAFTGDLVMPNGTIGYSGSFDFDESQLMDSLKRLSCRDFDAVLTGHMLRSTQPEGFWLHDGKSHVLQTLQAGKEGKWAIQGK